MPISQFNKSIRKQFIPLIKESGWRVLTSRKFARISANILQWISISVDGRGSTKRVMVEFGVQPLAARTLSMTMTAGGRFWSDKSEWRNMRNDDGAKLVADAMCEEWSVRIKALLDSAFDSHAFQQLVRSKEFPNLHHDNFCEACFFAERGDMEAAIHSFGEAKRYFDAEYERNQLASWALDHSQLCSLAIDAISGGTVDEIMAQWRLFSYNSLGLEKYFGPIQ